MRVDSAEGELIDSLFSLVSKCAEHSEVKELQNLVKSLLGLSQPKRGSPVA
jgi:hypothetical protein